MSEVAPKVEDIREDASQNVGPWREAWRGFKKSKVAVVGAAIVVFFIILAIIGPLIAKEGINEQVMADRLQPLLLNTY